MVLRSNFNDHPAFVRPADRTGMVGTHGLAALRAAGQVRPRKLLVRASFVAF